MNQLHTNRNTVHVEAFTRDGRRVSEETMKLEAFYERSYALLDDADFRKTAEIVRVTAVFCNASGEVSDAFEVHFDDSGLPVGERRSICERGSTQGVLNTKTKAGGQK